jgi:hypothetical protein
MRGNVYRSGRRRTGSILLTVAAGIAVGLAVILASVSSANAKAPATHARAARARPPVAVVITVSHQRAVKLAPMAHTAGHKIA